MRWTKFLGIFIFFFTVMLLVAEGPMPDSERVDSPERPLDRF